MMLCHLDLGRMPINWCRRKRSAGESTSIWFKHEAVIQADRSSSLPWGNAVAVMLFASIQNG